MTLEDEYAYATECQLATLEVLQMNKSTPKSTLAQQKRICDRMVAVCRSVPTDNLTCLRMHVSARVEQHCGRLVELLTRS